MSIYCTVLGTSKERWKKGKFNKDCEVKITKNISFESSVGVPSKVQEGAAYKVQEGVLYKVQSPFFRKIFPEGALYNGKTFWPFFNKKSCNRHFLFNTSGYRFWPNGLIAVISSRYIRCT